MGGGCDGARMTAHSTDFSPDRRAPSTRSTLSRRAWFKTTASGLGAVAAAHASPALHAAAAPPVEPDFRIRHGRIRQSIMGWTFDPMPVPELAKLCKAIGLVAMEGIDAKHYPAIRDLGLAISLVGSHGFVKGPFNPDNHDHCERSLREGIDLAVQVQCKNVITFTGMREPGISDEAGARHCVDLWKRVMGYAEEKRVNLCLEHLNTRDDTHPMKGHPGYFGDHVDLCVDLIRRVDSPNMKLLFDIYHVQVMDGDVIRRLRQLKDIVGHVHTAGVPGRGELDDAQELNYPAIMRALVDLGYTGYVAQEFIPTWPDRILALRHAAKVCDV
ncbi:MAG TPA: TIM barrel protein [Verrucomicrobiota bacterium]|nr:TIM barrel protein [Verrucomicrobiota bacterium]